MEDIGQIFAKSYEHIGSDEPDGVSIFPDEIPIYSIDDKESRGTENSFSWALPPLYKKNKNGKYSIWQIMYHQPTRKIYTVSGQMQGKLRIYPKDVKMKTGHNLGRQSQIDADSKYNTKIDEGRRMFGSDIPVQTFNVNLAKSYKQGEGHIKRWPVSVQPKLDGIRAYCYMSEGEVKIMSRKHKPHANLDILRGHLKTFFSVLPEGTIIDGELYNHEMSFNQIVSAVRSQTKKKSNDNIMYYIFDVITIPQVQDGIYPTSQVWEERVTLAQDYFSRVNAPGLFILPEFMAFNYEELLNYRDSFLQQGYEGVMIRQYGGTCIPGTKEKIGGNWVCRLDPTTRTPESIKISQYHQSSSSGDRPLNILKFKTFFEEEGVVIDIDSGEGTKKGVGMVIVRDIRGNEIRMAARQTDEIRSEWLRNKENYIGLPFTFEYQDLTDDNVPRFPVGKEFRNYE